MDNDHLKAHCLVDKNADDRIKLSFGIESLHSNLIASRHKILHDKTISKSEWKALVTKLIDKLDITIKNSITSDGLHLDQINYSMETIKESCKGFYKYQPNIIAELIRLSFLLVGGVPNLIEGSRCNSQYVSRRCRTVKYQQNLRQKARVILDYAHTIRKFDEFDDKYNHFFHDAKKFIEWVKEKQPELYCKLF